MTRTEAAHIAVEPFLKWAGGKRWLVKSGQKIFPDSFERYFEPFIGGGAVYFSTNTSSATLADINPNLINVYQSIKDDWRKVEKCLKKHSRRHNDDYYYEIRSSKPRTLHTKAARFLYLNRTCWNGLYRVNLKGEFNVPRGTKNSVVLDTDDFESVSIRLKDCEIHCQDFCETLAMAKEDDFVFVDPPYTVKHNLNGFIKYNEKIFSWEDQIRLKKAIEKAVHRGVKVTMTNADHPSIRTLYGKTCETETLERASVIAGAAQHRGATSEILMRFGWQT